MVIEKDTLFELTSGGRSDYEILCLCKALKSIDVDIVLAKYIKKFPQHAYEYKADFDSFVKWLVEDEKLAEKLLITNWYLGA